MQVAQQLQQAVDHHLNGNLEIAGQLYEAVLADDPNQPDALHLSGLIAYQKKNFILAEAQIEKAVKCAPKSAVYHNNLGLVKESLLQGDAAISHFQTALKLNEGYHCAGINASHALNRWCGQIDAYDKNIEQLVLTCFRLDYIDHELLSSVAAQLLIHKYKLNQLDLDSCLKGQFVYDPLLHTLLKKTICVTPTFEFALTALRDYFLGQVVSGKVPKKQKDLLCALACQCYHNDYVFRISQENQATLHVLEEKIKSEGKQVNVDSLIVYSLFHPLHEAVNYFNLEEKALYPSISVYEDAVTTSYVEPNKEFSLKDSIQVKSEINTEVSQEVRAMYEAYPYPRWQSFQYDPKYTITQFFQEDFPHFPVPGNIEGKINLLIAGGGTGKHPLSVAKLMPNANITCIDLSLSSIAYAARMAEKYHIQNVTFQQGDILALTPETQKYHIVESLGVIHHMEDPEKGWEQLANSVVSGGLLRLGVYSKTARACIYAAREWIASHNISDKTELDAFRQAILQDDPDLDPAILPVKNFSDFYATNECQDLICHVQEYCFTIPELKACIERFGLRFIGFELKNRYLHDEYLKMYPDDPHATNLDNWHEFELAHPNIFQNMYNFWCQKI